MNKKFAAVAICAALLGSASAHAAVQTYTDRAAFESALASVTRDNLNDLRSDTSAFSTVRNGYTIDFRTYHCVSGPSACGENSSKSFTYPGYLWSYEPGSFNFSSAITGFGLDFGNYYGSISSISLNGYVHTGSAGFFGIIDTENSFTRVTYAADGSGSLIDNVTFGTLAGSAEVPEPGSLALLGIALAAAGMARRRKS